MQFVLYALQVWLGFDGFTVARWALAAVAVTLSGVLLYRKASPYHFPFRVAWFSTFNVLVASTVGFCVLLWLMAGLVLPAMAAATRAERMFAAFYEFYGTMTFGVVVLTIFAWAFYKRAKKQEP